MERLRSVSQEAALALLGSMKRPELQKLAKEAGVKVMRVALAHLA